MTSDFWYWVFNSQILTLKLGKQENLRSIEYLYFYMLCSNLYFYQSMWAVLGFQILFCLAPSPSQISIFFVGKEYNVNLPDITWIQFVIFFFIKNRYHLFFIGSSLWYWCSRKNSLSRIRSFVWWETADNDGYMYVGLKSFIFINHSKLGMLLLLKLFF